MDWIDFLLITTASKYYDNFKRKCPTEPEHRKVLNLIFELIWDNSLSDLDSK